MTGALTSINCTSCGAGLDVLGGGRVLEHVCGYCGAVLDTQDNFKILETYEGLTRPKSPLRLGDQGQIDGVTFTVIGTLGVEERWAGRVWAWPEHQVFSPTHGYGWISVEEGRLVWTRKLREVPSPAWISSAQVEAASAKPKATLRGQRHTYYETSTTTVTFLEGEFNWRAKLGAKSKAVSLLGHDTMLSYTDTGAEREIEMSRLLSAEEAASFGVALAPRGVHPLEPYAKGPNTNFYRAVMVLGAIVALGVIIALSSLRGTAERLGVSGFADLPQNYSFTVTDTTRPVRVWLGTNLSNSWAFFEIALEDPAGAGVFETGREVSYYYGGRGEDSWREGSQHASLTFQPTVQGAHVLTVDVTEGEGLAALRDRGRLTVTVQQGYSSHVWVSVAFILFVLGALAAFSGGFQHNRARWRGSDWDDE